MSVPDGVSCFQTAVEQKECYGRKGVEFLTMTVSNVVTRENYP